MHGVAILSKFLYTNRMHAARAAVEVTHLHFVRLLAAGRDKARYVVKGGCNLRFWFGSVRYSEDLDLDAVDVPADAVTERVDSLLASKVLRETLRSEGIEVRRVSSPKRTDTTQRWKLELGLSGGFPVPTRIECSRRGGAGTSALEAVDPRIVQRYRMMPVLACHYDLPTAIRQKVHALADRREVQARDLFDLSVLFAHAGTDPTPLSDLEPRVPGAVARAWQLSYSDYRGQVVAFLEPEQADVLGTQEAWDAMQLQVVTALERLTRRP